MEFLNAINLEQLGTTGGLLAFVIWLYASEKKERIKWQDATFKIVEQAKKEAVESAQAFERNTRIVEQNTRVVEQVMQALKNG